VITKPLTPSRLVFFIHPFNKTTSVAKGGVADTRLKVKVIIKTLGLRLVGCKSCFIVGTR